MKPDRFLVVHPWESVLLVREALFPTRNTQYGDCEPGHICRISPPSLKLRSSCFPPSLRGLLFGVWIGSRSAYFHLKRRPPHQRTGARGEEDAYFYLRSLGYVMVARNFRTPRCRGEIDLIGWDRDVLCFVEVKTRTTHDVKTAGGSGGLSQAHGSGTGGAGVPEATRHHRASGGSILSAYTMTTAVPAR